MSSLNRKRIGVGDEGAPIYYAPSGCEEMPEAILDDKASQWNERPLNRTIEYQFGEQNRKKFETNRRRPEEPLRILGGPSQDKVRQ